MNFFNNADNNNKQDLANWYMNSENEIFISLSNKDKKYVCVGINKADQLTYKAIDKDVYKALYDLKCMLCGDYK